MEAMLFGYQLMCMCDRQNKGLEWKKHGLIYILT